MPNGILKTCRVGQRVKVNGKHGTVMEIADKHKVKFDDGEIGFFEDSQIDHEVDPSYAKGKIYVHPEYTGKDPFAQK